MQEKICSLGFFYIYVVFMPGCPLRVNKYTDYGICVLLKSFHEASGIFGENWKEWKFSKQ